MYVCNSKIIHFIFIKSHFTAHDCIILNVFLENKVVRISIIVLFCLFFINFEKLVAYPLFDSQSGFSWSSSIRSSKVFSIGFIFISSSSRRCNSFPRNWFLRRPKYYIKEILIFMNHVLYSTEKCIFFKILGEFLHTLRT